MPKTIRLSAQALTHLEEIARYTQERYGRDQRNKYLENIYRRLDQLQDNPQSGKQRPEIKAGTRSINEGRHVIFYRVRECGIEVLAVLHGQMDLKRELE